MAISTITLSIDNDVQAQAQEILRRGIPFTYVQEKSFPVTTEPAVPSAQKTPKPGGWEGKIWMAEDFDAPLEDFKEYM